MSDCLALAIRAQAVGHGELPDGTIDHAKACLLYGLTMACAAGVEEEPVWNALAEGASPLVGGASLLVRGGHRQAADAAAANAALFAARGQNDSHAGLAGHVGCVSLPALLAVAETEGHSGDALLRGIITAYEVTAALSPDLADAVRATGMRTTSVLGPAGTAAGIAVLRGDARDVIANAIGFGLDSGSGFLQCWADGTSEWRWQAGRSASTGIWAANIAHHGGRSSTHIVDGRHGLRHAFGAVTARIDPEPAWLIGETEFKPYPGCFINQLPVAALAAILKKRGNGLEQISRIELSLNPRDHDYPGLTEYGPFPAESGAIMSAAFMLAATLRDGAPAMRHFQKEFATGTLHDLSRLVTIIADSSVKPYQGRVVVFWRDGHRDQAEVEPNRFRGLGLAPIRALVSPLTDEWLWPDSRARFDRLTEAISLLPETEPKSLIQCCCP